jgi:hypothetical protein
LIKKKSSQGLHVPDPESVFPIQSKQLKTPHTHYSRVSKPKVKIIKEKKEKKLNLKKEETENHKLICNNRSNPDPKP